MAPQNLTPLFDYDPHSEAHLRRLRLVLFSEPTSIAVAFPIIRARPGPWALGLALENDQRQCTMVEAYLSWPPHLKKVRRGDCRESSNL